MKTYYKDFSDPVRAHEYELHRSHLGHNVRRVAVDDVTQRVYFSPGVPDPDTAIDVKDCS